MPEFDNWDKDTRPLLYGNSDWNPLLDHGILSPVDWIIYLSGSQYRGVNGTTKKLTYSGSSYATVRNSVTGSLTGTVFDRVANTLEGYSSGVQQTRINLTGSFITGDMNFTNITASRITGSTLVSGSTIKGAEAVIHGPTSLSGSLHVTGSTEFDQTAGQLKSGSWYGGQQTANYIVWSGSGLYWAKDSSTGKIYTSGSDAATVIQAANDNLLRLGTIGGGVIQCKIPSNVESFYSIDNQINLGTGSPGMGRFKPLIFDGGGAMFQYTSGSGACFRVTTTDAGHQNSRIRNLHIRSLDRTADRVAIKIEPTTGRWFGLKNITIEGFKVGVYIDSCNTIWGEKLAVHNCGAALKIERTNGSSVNAVYLDYIKVAACNVGLEYATGSVFSMRNSLFESNTGSILIRQGYAMEFDNLYMEGNVDYDFMFTGSEFHEISIKNSRITSYGVTNAIYARNVNRLTLENIYFTNGYGTSMFDVDDSVYATLRNVDIRGLTGASLGAGNNFIWRGQGFENNGTTTLTAQSGSVAHSLVGTPQYVQLTPSGSASTLYMGGLGWYPSGSTGIWIVQTGSGTVPVNWRVEYKP